MRRQWTCIAAILAIGVPCAGGHAESPSARSAALFPARVLAAHNETRLRVGVAPLCWDNQLGAQAAIYAVQLAATNTFAHSAASTRHGAGENLWMGTRGAFSVENMVGSWASERRLFVAGIFPNISRNGSWDKLGHYTQMIWPSTTRVGCAIATNASADYLVCRYSPPGNVHGTALAIR